MIMKLIKINTKEDAAVYILILINISKLDLKKEFGYIVFKFSLNFQKKETNCKTSNTNIY